MNTVGQLGSFKDPYLQREMANIYKLLVQRIQPENMNLPVVAAAIAKEIRFGQLVALQEFLSGDVSGEKIWLQGRRGNDDSVLTISQDDSVLNRTSSAVYMGNDSDNDTSYTLFLDNLGTGRTLYVSGGRGTSPLVYLAIDGGSGHIISTTRAGCFLSNGGVWTDACTRKRKVFLPLMVPDPIEYLSKLPIRRYRYKDTAEEHYGPTAEEFRDVYRVGQGDGLGAMDLAAVTALAVKCLTKELDKAKRRIDKLERRLAERTRRCRPSRPRAHK